MVANPWPLHFREIADLALRMAPAITPNGDDVGPRTRKIVSVLLHHLGQGLDPGQERIHAETDCVHRV